MLPTLAAPSITPDYYDDYIDFAALALQDADFAKVCGANDGKVDLQDPKALQQLTKSLLKRDFGLAIELPDDRLCPPVPVRYNYVHWVQELLDTTSDNYDDTYDPSRRVFGIDIGTGASAIYPLLFASTRPNYRLLATELDSTSHASAAHNITLNNLSSRIRLHQPPSATAPLLPLDDLSLSHASFVICNPPFYASAADLVTSAAAKSSPPHAVCTGADVEMIYAPSFGSSGEYDRNPGGDVGFCFRIVEESVGLQERVQWFTCMMGRLESVGKVVARLKEVGVRNWAVRCLRAGKTRRWAVGWSWGARRPRNDLVRSSLVNIGGVQPFPTEQAIHAEEKTAEELWDTVGRALNPLDLRLEIDAERKTVLGFAEKNVWSRAARRKRAREGDEDSSKEAQDEEVALGFRIKVNEGNLDIRWLEGMEEKLFESFMGMLQRAIHPR